MRSVGNTLCAFLHGLSGLPGLVKKRITTMSELVVQIPVAKIFYTGLLLFLIFIVTREIYTLWGRQQLYVGKFEYFNEGKADAEASKNFPSAILAQHHMLRSALIEETKRREQ